jgi:hypothetical protein
MRRVLVLAAVVLSLASAGCGGDEAITDADAQALVAARERFLDYCGERKANGADETEPVSPRTEAHVTRTVKTVEDHGDESFLLDGKKVTVRAYVTELRDILDGCSDQQVFRIDEALG